MHYLDAARVSIVLSFLDALYRVARVHFKYLDPLEVATALDGMAARIRNEEGNKRKDSDRLVE